MSAAASRLKNRFEKASTACATAAVLLGGVVLAGWVFDIRVLTNVHPSLTSMKANTALLFVFSGLGVWFTHHRSGRRAHLLLGTVVAAVAGATLAEYALDVSFGIDELLVIDGQRSAGAPGRMAPATALGFLCIGVATVVVGIQRLQWLRQLVILLVTAVAFLALCGYLFGIRSLYTVGPYSSVALHTSVGLLLLSLAALFLRPTEGLMSLVSADSSSGAFVRTLFPVLLLFPFALGWLALLGEQAGFYDGTYSKAIIVVGNAASLTATVLWIGLRLQVHELGQKRASDHFRGLVEATAQIVWTTNAAGAVEEDSPSWRRFTGQSYGQWSGWGWLDALHPDDRDRVEPLWRQAVADKTVVDTEYRIRHVSGDWRWTAFRAVPLIDADGALREWVGMNTDITERRRGEEERTRLLTELQTLTRELESRVDARTRDIRESEARFRSLFHESPVALLEKDYTETTRFLEHLRRSVPGNVIEHLRSRADLVSAAAATVRVLAANRRSVELFEADDEHHLMTSIPELTSPDPEAFVDECHALLEQQSEFEREQVRQTLHGRRLDVILRLVPLPGHEADWSRVLVSIGDITARKEAERQLRASHHRQEVLLKEVHHRVKNNLSVISSLLYLQQISAGNERIAALFEESGQRVRSMALAHETLYGSKDLGRIDFGDYSRTLARELASTYAIDDRVLLKSEVEVVTLNVDQAVPSGLILNELITNAFKHAFPDGKSGSIGVRVRRTPEGACEISVSDNGVGLPASVRTTTDDSLGLRLMRSLARQLNATLEFGAREHGTEVRLSFAIEPERVDLRSEP